MTALRQTALAFVAALPGLAMTAPGSVPSIQAKVEHWPVGALLANNPANPYAPQKSDVIFSTRFERPEAVSVAQEFAATRVEWVYSARPAFVAGFRARAMQFGGTVNSNVATPDDAGVARNFDGEPIVAPWMSSWGAKWVSTNNTVTRDALFALAKKTIDAGSASLHFDGPELQALSTKWGGDFSDGSLAGFAEYVAARPSLHGLKPRPSEIARMQKHDYREYLRSKFKVRNNDHYLQLQSRLPTTPSWQRYLEESVGQFFGDFRRFLDSYGGKRTALSLNLHNIFDLRAFEVSLVRHFDYLMIETPVRSTGYSALRSGISRALGLGHVPSLIPNNIHETREQLLVFYALGATPLVPWDVYMGSNATGANPRYFGQPKDYADIFTFVRRYPHLFDGWDNPPLVGIVLNIGATPRKRAESIADALVARGIPFSVFISGGDEHGVSLRLAHANALKALILVDESTEQKQPNLLGSLNRNVPVFRGTPPDTWLRKNASLFQWAGSDVPFFALKIRTGQPVPKEFAIHVVRGAIRNAATQGHDFTPGELTLTLPGFASVQEARWYSATENPRSLVWSAGSNSVRLAIPGGVDFGIIHLVLAAQS